MKKFIKALLLAAVLFPVMLTAAVKPSDYIPADAAISGVVNVSEIINQPLFKSTLEPQLKNELATRGLTLQDIGGKVAFGFIYAVDNPAENLACSFIALTDKPGAARKLFTAVGMDMQKENGAKKIRIGKKQAIQGPGFRLVLESPQLLILQAINGTVKEYPALTAAKNNSFAKYADSSIAVAVNLKIVAKLLTNQLPPEQLKEFSGLEAMLATVKFTADGGVDLMLTVSHTTPAKCSETSTQYTQAIEMFKADPAVSAVINKVSAAANGKEFTLRASFTAQEFQTITTQAMMMVMSAISPASQQTPKAAN